MLMLTICEHLLLHLLFQLKINIKLLSTLILFLPGNLPVLYFHSIIAFKQKFYICFRVFLVHIVRFLCFLSKQDGSHAMSVWNTTFVELPPIYRLLNILIKKIISLYVLLVYLSLSVTSL